MSDLLWQKPGVQVDAHIQAFLAGEDVILDREFFLYDIQASRAHAQGLLRIGILAADEFAGIHAQLAELAKDFDTGDFVLDARYEDGHSAIEARLIERLGDAGRKIHTGRSRNDQVLVATRLWLKAKLARLRALCVDCADVALARAEAEAAVPLPGYTHLQRAVVSSLGMWWAAWAEAFIDDAQRARDTHAWVDANPLGSAAGYGVNLPLDRDGATEALDFGRLQVSAAYAQLSRGKFEMAAIEALASALLDLRRLAWDLSLFTSAEYGFVALPAQYTTGSSIMPNKRNPDVVELMRASYASAAAARTEIEQLLSLPSGYHRDLQFTKGAIFHAFGRGLGALELLPDLLRNLEWNPDAMRAALDPSMYATDLAVDLARQGLPFRDAYRQAADPARWAHADADASLRARVSPGAAADLRLDTLKARARGARVVTGADVFVEQALPAWKRAVLKVGSSLLADRAGLSPHHAVHLAAFVHAARAKGREVVIVSSGAVAAGRAVLHAAPRPGAAMAERQALAALGQAKLMAFWQGLFAQPVAQVLLTHDDVRNRRRYLNARATLRELLRCGALPVVNENDTVSVDELKLGDNDTLAAIVAALIDADMLFIATDIDGLYDRDPRAYADAKPLPLVSDPGDDALAMAGGAGSATGTGGMRTKILAAQRAGAAGIDTVLFNGTRAAVSHALGEDRLTGTWLLAGRSRIAARKHWLRHAPVEGGAAILIDEGAASAIVDSGASLLPIGVLDARGEFRRGDLVEIALAESAQDIGAVAAGRKAIARGVTQYSAADIRRIARKRSPEIEAILGYNYGDSIVHRDDLSLHVPFLSEPADV